MDRRENFEMRRFAWSIFAIVALPIALAVAETSQQPYAGLEARSIKALSEEQIADLRSGRGMGLALAAELNGYPGPRHVIDLAAPLQLSDEQRVGVQALFEAMQAETVPIGEALIAQEAELERRFAERTITVERLDALTQDIGAIQASLRAAHLRYHIATLAALTPEQVARYNELRGYVSGAPVEHRHGVH
jgi:Spy/CpxP family protein refolding chaperone